MFLKQYFSFSTKILFFAFTVWQRATRTRRRCTSSRETRRVAALLRQSCTQGPRKGVSRQKPSNTDPMGEVMSEMEVSMSEMLGIETEKKKKGCDRLMDGLFKFKNFLSLIRFLFFFYTSHNSHDLKTKNLAVIYSPYLRWLSSQSTGSSYN